jgi:hypothetical protein
MADEIRFAECGECVGGFAGLGYNDHGDAGE